MKKQPTRKAAKGLWEVSWCEICGFMKPGSLWVLLIGERLVDWAPEESGILLGFEGGFCQFTKDHWAVSNQIRISGQHWEPCLAVWLVPISVYCPEHTPGESESHSVMSDSLQPHELYSPWNSLGQNIGLGSLSIFQGIFPTQGLNPGLPHCRWILYQLSHRGIPRILEWVACPFSRRSSPHTNWTGISCIAGRFCTNSGKPWKKGYQGNPDGRRQHWLSVLVIV